jgi:hypothetical protein
VFFDIQKTPPSCFLANASIDFFKALSSAWFVFGMSSCSSTSSIVFNKSAKSFLDSLSYFFIDFLRGDSAIVFGILRASQYFTFTFAIFAAILVINMKQIAHKNRSEEFPIYPKIND